MEQLKHIPSERIFTVLDFTIMENKMQKYMILLIAIVYLIGLCQSFCFAQELEGLVVYFAFEDGNVEKPLQIFQVMETTVH